MNSFFFSYFIYQCSFAAVFSIVSLRFSQVSVSVEEQHEALGKGGALVRLINPSALNLNEKVSNRKIHCLSLSSSESSVVNTQYFTSTEPFKSSLFANVFTHIHKYMFTQFLHYFHCRSNK